MNAARQVILTQYPSPPLRFTVGDVIRCAAFWSGLTFTGDKLIAVAWHSQSYPEYHAETGRGVIVNDDSRGCAPFLVTSIELEQNEGPDDLSPGEVRLCRKIKCVRLEDSFILREDSEEIYFVLDEGMSVIRPEETAIKILGFAALPIYLKHGYQDEEDLTSASSQ